MADYHALRILGANDGGPMALEEIDAQAVDQIDAGQLQQELLEAQSDGLVTYRGGVYELTSEGRDRFT